MIGAFEKNPEFVVPEPGLVFGQYDFDWSIAEPYLEVAAKNVPIVAGAGYRANICGPESFTPDNKAIFGHTQVRLRLTSWFLLF